ncbi:MAG: hypothetical protein ACO3VF_03835 [Tamlana sp.]
MSKELPQPQQSEEVDLGQLFKMIGNMFDRFFKFIGSIFRGIYSLLILFMLFIQKHFLKFIIAGVVGLVTGVFIDIKKDPKYVSTMVLEPNFNSVQQLYNNVDFYNALALANDISGLSEAMNISKKEATYLKKFSVESYSDENQKVKLFDDFVRSLDTTTQKTINMKDYLKNFNSLEARFHTVTVVATNNAIAKKIQPLIIKSISKNEYFNLQKNISDININLQDSIYNKQMKEIDSLQALYKKVMLKEAEKPMQGTNISLGEDTNKEIRELSIINKMGEIKSSLVMLNEERANRSSILNVISEFPNKGVKEKGLLKSYKFLAPCFFIGILLTFLGLLSFNTYLNNYKKIKK